MTARWVAFGLWAAVAASLIYWALKLFVPGFSAPLHTTVASVATPPRGDLSRLLGVDAAPATAEAVPDPRFHLIGVVAPRAAGASREGLALIAVDDKPARAYRVGAVIDGDTVLQAVHARSVALGPRDGPARVSLDIPPPAAAATGKAPLSVPAVRLPPPRPGFQGQASPRPTPAGRPMQAEEDQEPATGGMLPTQ